MNAKDILAKLAPTAATLLAGPFAGMAVGALGDALGLSEPTKAKIEQALSAGQLSGEQLAAVKIAEQNLKLELERLGVQRDELAAGDRKSARETSVAGGTHKLLFVLSVLLLTGTLGMEAYTLVNGVPSGTSEFIVGRVLGLFDAIAMMVMSFWYGTTSGSHQKTELLAQAAPIK